MEEIFFTADTHFGHGRNKPSGSPILKHQKHTRPFATVEEMDEALIERWNARVKRNDRIYHLGDFSFYNAKDTEKILRRLHGQKHLTLGNHDRFVSGSEIPKYFKSISQIKDIRIGSQKIVLCHYAMLSWNVMHHGSWMLHGHSHGSLCGGFQCEYCRKFNRTSAKRMDVGVDAVPNLSPISFDEVKAIMDKREFIPVDHHRSGREY